MSLGIRACGNGKSRQRPTLPPGYPGSTIGAGGLNGRVRNGNGCDPSAMITGMSFSKNDDTENPSIAMQGSRSRPGFEHCKRSGQASRPISTRKLKALLPLYIGPINLVVCEGSLGRLPCGRHHLEAGFTLRCFQRLSQPDIATQLCHRRDNWCTRGPSIPVLSY
jgi:hypothetical protein